MPNCVHATFRGRSRRRATAVRVRALRWLCFTTGSPGIDQRARNGGRRDTRSRSHSWRIFRLKGTHAPPSTYISLSTCSRLCAPNDSARFQIPSHQLLTRQLCLRPRSPTSRKTKVSQATNQPASQPPLLSLLSWLAYGNCARRPRIICLRVSVPLSTTYETTTETTTETRQ
jgi:hypothetical protein